MLRKIFILSFTACAATLLFSDNAWAWGCGSWSRSGSASFTGRYGNTYSRSFSSSGSGYHYGGYGGYHYGGYYGGGAYYGGGFHPGAFAAGYASGVYNSQPYY
jgi:hypothetical protein